MTNISYLNNLSDLDIDQGGQDNILIEGDNLDVLKAMQYTHTNSIDIIYIDPPYSANADVRYVDTGWSRTEWLEFLKPRIRLAHPLLKESGVIMVSIDDSALTPWLEILIQNTFGATNKIATRPWTGKSGGANGRHLYMEHECVITYAKDISKFESNRMPVDQQAVAEDSEVFDNNDGRRYVQGDDLHAWGGIDKSDAEFPLVAPDGTEFYHERKDGTYFDWRVPRSLKVKGMSKQDNLNKMIADGDVYFYKNRDGKWRAASKKWLNDGMTRLTPSIITQGKTSTTMIKAMLGRDAFEYPKPIALMEELIRWAGPRDAVVLDFFAGSGSTGHGVASLNDKDGGDRKFILVTNNDDGIFYDATYPRVKAALTGEWANGKGKPLPGSLRVFTTDVVSNEQDEELLTDYALINSLSNKFAGMVSLKENLFKFTTEPDYTVIKSDNKTALVWTNVYDDDELEHVLLQISPDVVYVACESIGVYGNTLDDFKSYDYPLKFVKTEVSADNFANTIDKTFNL